MKIRLKGNSLRLRVGQSELRRFIEEGHIEETTQLGPSREARFRYALDMAPPGSSTAMIHHEPYGVTVAVTPEQADLWKMESQVGIYTSVELGPENKLEVMVEKDFACLDRDDSDNEDTFANPGQSANCQVG